MIAEQQPDLLVTLIHGTFAKGAAWTKPESALSRELKAQFRSRIVIEAFEWSGGNSIGDRLDAAKALQWHLMFLQGRYPEAQQFLIAHSHGGNIAAHSLHDLPYSVNIGGIICLSTPFFHARVRQHTFWSQSFFLKVFSGFFLLIYFIIRQFISATTLVDIGFLVLCVVIAILLSAFFSGGIQGVSETAELVANEVIHTRIPVGTKLCILRIVGDEASRGLGAVELLSWATSRLFARLSQTQRPYWNRILSRRRLPRWVRLSWWFNIAVVLTLGAAVYARVTEHFPDEASDNLDLFIQMSCPLIIIFTLVTTCVTILYKINITQTSVVRQYIFGAVFLCFVCALGAQIKALGALLDVPGMNRLTKLIIGIFIMLRIEVNTEASPDGEWTVIQFDRSALDNQDDFNALAHSAYSDPRVRNELIRWLQMVMSRHQLPSGRSGAGAGTSA